MDYLPKAVGYLYERMVDRDYILSCITEGSKHKQDRPDVAMVLADVPHYVEAMYQLVAAEDYTPTTPVEKRIYDQSGRKWRTIKIVPFFPDGIMHRMIVGAISPVIMRGMYRWSCASIPGRGTGDILVHVKRIMARDVKGTRVVAEMDARHYYDSIPIPELMRRLGRKIKDKRMLRLIYSILSSAASAVVDGVLRGLAIGFYLCQWLANFYFEALDHYIMDLPGVRHMTRHMDNINIFGTSKKKMRQARAAIAEFMEADLGVAMKGNWAVYPTRARMVASVGYRFSHRRTMMRKWNFLRFTRQCRKALKKTAHRSDISPKLASGILSRGGQLKACDGLHARQKYLDAVGVKKLKGVVRNESKRRQNAGRRVQHGGAAAAA